LRIDLLTLARRFQESVGRFDFPRVETVFAIGSAVVEREIIPLTLWNITPKDGEDRGGLGLELHDRFSFIVK